VALTVEHIPNFGEFIDYSSHKFKFKNARSCLKIENLNRLVVKCHYHMELAHIIKHYYVFNLVAEVRKLCILVIVAKRLLIQLIQLLQRGQLELVRKIEAF
jgi:hypothetical protein